MEIKFLNVGHGDSVILDWKELGVSKVGIVDCKKYNNTIPTVEYLSSIKGLKCIEIIILSHPHIDHYSGFLELLDYIEKANIKVKYFVHSLFGDPKYLNWSEAKSEDRKKLDEIILKVRDFKDNKNLTEDIQWAIQNWTIPLGDDYVIKALAPSDSEINTRISKIKYYRKENKFLCSSSSNYLSTILLLTNTKTNNRFLLTSDAVDITFERLQKAEALKEKIFGVQVPHHGSTKSLFKKFWMTLDYSDDKVANISSGLNEKYKLPDYEVINFFNSLGFKQDITNYINGYKDFFDDLTPNTYKLINALDDDSEIILDEYPAKKYISTII